MKYFKLLICVFCLAILMTACGGKVRKKMSAPDENEIPTVKIETVDHVIANLMIEGSHQAKVQ